MFKQVNLGSGVKVLDWDDGSITSSCSDNKEEEPTKVEKGKNSSPPK